MLDEKSTSHDSCDETIFSQHLRTPSPCLSVNGLSTLGGELSDIDSHAEPLSTPSCEIELDEYIDESQVFQPGSMNRSDTSTHRYRRDR